MQQEALLLQRDHTTRLSVEILQLRNILLEKACNQRITFKYTQGHRSGWPVFTTSLSVSEILPLLKCTWLL